jgi:hypothetical protein
VSIAWRDTVDHGDLQAAESFLSLLYKPKRARRLADGLAGSPVLMFRADDVLRAACCDPVPADDPRVVRQEKKVAAGKALKPVLLTVTKRGTHIANGEHRASWAFHDAPATPVAVAVAYD